MEDEFNPEKFAYTLNTIGTWLSMVNQMFDQDIYTSPSCVYFSHFSQKLMDLQVSLIAMNAYYAHLYETYKEENTNG
jgi:hypothetical protein